MATTNFCHYCGRDLDYTQRSDSKFCDDTCRSAYHAERRRMQRAEERAAEAILALGDILTGESDNALPARDTLTRLRAAVDTYLGAIFWECRKCGQRTYERPTSDTACSFCGESSWAITLPNKAKNP
jgi:rubrerythrin